MSSEIAIKVENLSKCYQIYDQPRDRLKQFVLPRMQHLIGRPPRQYYREFWALKNVSFDVKKGESVGIIGRNGSGKSTLLQIITGTLAPTSGAATTNGRIAALLELGSGFNPEFTGRENVYLNGALLGFSSEQINEKFDAIAAFADIGEHLDQPVKTYSSGMLVRLAFAVQVQVEPEILIVDEALAVGDALFQKRCFQRIEKLVSDGTTLLFVSHDQESVRTLTNRALLLNKGCPIEWGLSSEVVLSYRKLLHEEEAAYFASLTKNLVERAAQAPLPSDPPAAAADAVPANAAPCMGTRSDRLSFGDGEVKIIKVETLDSNDQPSSLFYPGERLRIRVTCESFASIDKLNIAIRLRNKEGVKIYSWGTLNQDMTNRTKNMDAPIFWVQRFEAGDRFQVLLDCDCALGENLYEVQAAVSHEETMNYLSQRMLHWVDEAAFFQVSIKRDEYFFGGVVDLRVSATW
ncbi:ABC transporter ATP-binding protein [Laribacter hongkongensis]|uniref:ABC transporter ATP-binding protein n=1 Tax=Laribacter hongkongensis TaxID=168471 RepID=UPI001EFDF32F|nr:ABC transporter ATP-binding protein [Laribacter hongkongensis]MCG9032994.1 ABC transporter ATP-binding protein [Laribacter hongkongensis]MCG9093080.1 ABC transporter ATP-binding protein [Laribacter hongkongensis]